MSNATKFVRVFHIDDGNSITDYVIRDSNSNSVYGTCSTAENTSEKAVTIGQNVGWGLATGSTVIAKFTYAVPSGATLNVGGTGAKSIYINDAAIGASVINAGDTVTFVYDGTKYIVIAIDRVMSEINNKLNSSLKGAANGLAELDSTGKVPASQLPSYVDDVLEYADLSSFPVTGESGKIYVTIDTKKVYRWSGSAYVEITNPDVMSGATSSTNGIAGIVPQPVAGDDVKYLKGDGTWDSPGLSELALSVVNGKLCMTYQKEVDE